jgi:hypothetical protein
VWWHIPIIQLQEVDDKEDDKFKASSGKKVVRFCLKNKIRTKGLRGIVQVIECLPSMHKALSSITRNKSQNTIHLKIKQIIKIGIQASIV